MILMTSSPSHARAGADVPRPMQQSRQRTQAGTTLLEVLVAMLVLSIGLLGIAGLSAASLRYSQGGWARASISSGLSDLADRVLPRESVSQTLIEAARLLPPQGWRLKIAGKAPGDNPYPALAAGLSLSC